MKFLRKRKKERIDRIKEKDSGELSQTMIIISGLAVAGVVVTGGIAGASLTKGEESARCISEFSTFNSGTAGSDCATVANSNNGGTLPPAGENENATPGEPIEKNHTLEECFETSTVPGGTSITKYLIAEKPEDCGKFVIIPDELDGAPVVDIAQGSFKPFYYSDSGVKEEHRINNVVIPSTVKTIGKDSFRNNNLTSIEIPDSVERILGTAFYGNNLTSVNIPNSVNHIGNWSFAFNKLTSVSLPDSIEYIEAAAFSNNQLTYVNLPDSLTYISSLLFYKNQLTSVTVPKDVTNITASAFAENPNLEEIRLPTGIKVSSNAIPRSTKITYY